MLNRTIAIALIVLASSSPFCSVARAESAQQSKMKDCNAQADAKGFKGPGKGPDRQAFMKECLSAKPAAAAVGNPQQEKMKSCNKEASAKGLKGAERKQFMSGCLKK
ncbi:MAG: phosphate starvation-inducible protein PsiF [Deltaproteobacteria bacterium]|nr:phosphate starvation-inducible protein PsiF [Deltaproteobacteria bacterium]